MPFDKTFRRRLPNGGFVRRKRMDEEEDGGLSERVRGDLEGRIPAEHKLL